MGYELIDASYDEWLAASSNRFLYFRRSDDLTFAYPTAVREIHDKPAWRGRHFTRRRAAWL
jgi:hypothetical protein